MLVLPPTHAVRTYFKIGTGNGRIVGSRLRYGHSKRGLRYEDVILVFFLKDFNLPGMTMTMTL